MKKFKDFEEDIYKCSRCGLCQSVCPVYKASLNECAVSKGKFNILNGIIKGELKFTQNVKKYLDLCTNCNACKNFCPSSIDAKSIFISAKDEFHKTCKVSLFEKIINSYTFFKTLLLCTNIAGKIYRLLGVKYLIKLLRNIISQSTIGKRVLLLDHTLKNEFPTKQSKQNSYTQTALYFEGCFNKYITPETKNAVKKLFENTNIKLLVPNTECCGVSYLNDGNIKEFKNIVKRNLKKLNQNCDYIITDCASCNETLKKYKDYYKNEHAEIVNTKTRSVFEFIQNNKYKAKKHFRISIHKPCHEEFDIRSFVANNIENISYIEPENNDTCCGFSGTFALKNPDISREISKNKALSYIKENVEIILTTCPACQIGIEQGLLEAKQTNKTIVMNLFVFLAKYCLEN